nr:MAG TPA: hypothetical protein [Caudoviricetes sp.]
MRGRSSLPVSSRASTSSRRTPLPSSEYRRLVVSRCGTSASRSMFSLRRFARSRTVSTFTRGATSDYRTGRRHRAVSAAQVAISDPPARRGRCQNERDRR